MRVLVPVSRYANLTQDDIDARVEADRSKCLREITIDLGQAHALSPRVFEGVGLGVVIDQAQ